MPRSRCKKFNCSEPSVPAIKIPWLVAVGIKGRLQNTQLQRHLGALCNWIFKLFIYLNYKGNTSFLFSQKLSLCSTLTVLWAALKFTHQLPPWATAPLSPLSPDYAAHSLRSLYSSSYHKEVCRSPVLSCRDQPPPFLTCDGGARPTNRGACLQVCSSTILKTPKKLM